MLRHSSSRLFYQLLPLSLHEAFSYLIFPIKCTVRFFLEMPTAPAIPYILKCWSSRRILGTRFILKVSYLPSYLLARQFERPMRSMSLNSNLHGLPRCHCYRQPCFARSVYLLTECFLRLSDFPIAKNNGKVKSMNWNFVSNLKSVVRKLLKWCKRPLRTILREYQRWKNGTMGLKMVAHLLNVPQLIICEICCWRKTSTDWVRSKTWNTKNYC